MLVPFPTPQRLDDAPEDTPARARRDLALTRRELPDERVWIDFSRPRDIIVCELDFDLLAGRGCRVTEGGSTATQHSAGTIAEYPAGSEGVGLIIGVTVRNGFPVLYARQMVATEGRIYELRGERVVHEHQGPVEIVVAEAL